MIILAIIPYITGIPVTRVTAIILAASKKYMQVIVNTDIPNKFFFILYFLNYFLISDSPVISFGIGKFNNSNIVGAISASFPSFSSIPSFVMIQCTGFVV